MDQNVGEPGRYLEECRKTCYENENSFIVMENVLILEDRYLLLIRRKTYKFLTFLLVRRSLFISFYSLIIPLSVEIPKSEVVAVLNILPMGNKYNKFIAHYFIAKSVSFTNIYFCRHNKTPCVL